MNLRSKDSKVIEQLSLRLVVISNKIRKYLRKISKEKCKEEEREMLRNALVDKKKEIEINVDKMTAEEILKLRNNKENIDSITKPILKVSR